MAERRFDEVRQFARTRLFDVDDALRNGPTAGREKLVQTSLANLDRLSAERISDAALLRGVAGAYERIGDIQGGAMHANLGRPNDAAASLAKARVLRESVARLAPLDFDNVAGLLSVNERLGDSARGLGDLKATALFYRAAADQAGLLARARPTDLGAQIKRI